METETSQDNLGTSDVAKERYATKGFIKETVQFLAIALVIGFPIRFFVAQPFIVNGESMVPTFEDSDYLIVDELTYAIKKPERGDIIVFHNPNNNKNAEFFIKRIIGLPSETVTIEDDKVRIENKEHPSGFVLNEQYLRDRHTGTLTRTLGAKDYFVMGDNRGASFDSRSWGPLKQNLITGRVLLRLWPIAHAGYFPGKATYENSIDSETVSD